MTTGHVLFTKPLRCFAASTASTASTAKLLASLARLAHAPGARDDLAVPLLVTRTIEAARPHLRYEKESLYPALADEDVVRVIAARSTGRSRKTSTSRTGQAGCVVVVVISTRHRSIVTSATDLGRRTRIEQRSLP